MRGKPPFELSENIYGHRKRLLWIIHQIEKMVVAETKQRIKVLEVGCGTGVMVSLPLASLGYDVLGIDSDRNSINYANSINPYTNAKFLCTNVAELSDSYNVVVLSEVLEHLSDPNELLSVCGNLLAPQGILIVTVPNGYGWFEFEQLLWDRLHLGNVVRILKVRERMELVKGWFMGEQDYAYPYVSTFSGSPHQQRFTFGKIRKLIMENGFRILDSCGSTLIAGKFSNLFLTGFKIPMQTNNWLGTIMKPLASGFYLCCAKATKY